MTMHALKILVRLGLECDAHSVLSQLALHQATVTILPWRAPHLSRAFTHEAPRPSINNQSKGYLLLHKIRKMNPDFAYVIYSAPVLSPV